MAFNLEPSAAHRPTVRGYMSLYDAVQAAADLARAHGCNSNIVAQAKGAAYGVNAAYCRVSRPAADGPLVLVVEYGARWAPCDGKGGRIRSQSLSLA